MRADSHATRIVVDGQRAAGVAICMPAWRATARAGDEVILSGGTINSPQLLMLSGIGPGRPAARVRHRRQGRPGGSWRTNLNDHTMTPIVWATQDSTDLLQLASPENMALWQERGGGPFASNGGEVGGYMSTDGDDVPNVQFTGGPTSFVDHGRFNAPLENFTR